MTSLNPTLSVGSRIAKALREHLGFGSDGRPCAIGGAARRSRHPRAVEAGAWQYSNQISGHGPARGHHRRACEPRVLIADGPTTALDVTVQALILELLARERRSRRVAMMLVTHDLGILAGHTEDVAVMNAGRSSSERRRAH